MKKLFLTCLTLMLFVGYGFSQTKSKAMASETKTEILVSEPKSKAPVSVVQSRTAKTEVEKTITAAEKAELITKLDILREQLVMKMNSFSEPARIEKYAVAIQKVDAKKALLK